MCYTYITYRRAFQPRLAAVSKIDLPKQVPPKVAWYDVHYIKSVDLDDGSRIRLLKATAPITANNLTSAKNDNSSSFGTNHNLQKKKKFLFFC